MVYPILLPHLWFCASVSEFSTRLACITFLIIESFEKSHPNKASQGGWKMTSKSLDSLGRDLTNKMACLQRKWVVSKVTPLLLSFKWCQNIGVDGAFSACSNYSIFEETWKFSFHKHTFLQKWWNAKLISIWTFCPTLPHSYTVWRKLPLFFDMLFANL